MPYSEVYTLIHLITGDGGGKTTSAFGIALRSLGQNKKVVIVQFMKGRKDIGEYKAIKKFRKCIIKQFGTKEFIDLKNPSQKDIELANKGLEFAHKSLKFNPFLIVLDEINLACAVNLVKVNDVIEFLKKCRCFVVLTGRKAPKELIDFCDIVTVVNDIKSNRKNKTAKGIEY